jgi:hypothetical protein
LWCPDSNIVNVFIEPVTPERNQPRSPNEELEKAHCSKSQLKIHQRLRKWYWGIKVLRY